MVGCSLRDHIRNMVHRNKLSKQESMNRDPKEMVLKKANDINIVFTSVYRQIKFFLPNV